MQSTLWNCCFRRLNHHVVDTDTLPFENTNFSISYLRIIGFDLANPASLITLRLKLDSFDK